MYQPGYAAWVGDAPALVSKSPDGFVCVEMPAGVCSVRLSYVPPTGLRLLFWLSFLSIAGVVVATAAYWMFRRFSSGASGEARPKRRPLTSAALGPLKTNPLARGRLP